jgi:SprT protein
MINLPTSEEANNFFRGVDPLTSSASDTPEGYRYLLRIYRNAHAGPICEATHALAMKVVHRFLRSMRQELLTCPREDYYLKREAFGIMHRLCLANRVSHPMLTFDLRGKTAGDAARDGSHVRMNMTLYRENVIYFHVQTLPHEFCHAWKDQRGMPGKPHGGEWKSLMVKVGAEPLTTHSLDVTNALVRRCKQFEYICLCKRAPYQVGPDLHQAIQKGETYTCKNCGYQIAWKTSDVSELLTMARASRDNKPRTGVVNH